MAPDNPKYDVAISFLAEDISIAQAMHDKLSVGLDVFFFPRNQEELAGTIGLESMRTNSPASDVNSSTNSTKSWRSWKRRSRPPTGRYKPPLKTTRMASVSER